jgi:hypothetical protein
LVRCRPGWADAHPDCDTHPYADCDTHRHAVCDTHPDGDAVCDTHG